MNPKSNLKNGQIHIWNTGQSVVVILPICNDLETFDSAKLTLPQLCVDLAAPLTHSYRDCLCHCDDRCPNSSPKAASSTDVVRTHKGHHVHRNSEQSATTHCPSRCGHSLSSKGGTKMPGTGPTSQPDMLRQHDSSVSAPTCTCIVVQHYKKPHLSACYLNTPILELHLRTLLYDLTSCTCSTP